MAGYKVEQIPSAPLCVMGEGPHWDIERQSLFYNDIYGGSIHRYDYKENKTYNCRIDGIPVIGFIVPVKNNPQQFVLGAGTKLTLIEWDGKSPKGKFVKNLAEVEKDKVNTRFNDAKVDPKGRLFAGTMRLEDVGDIFEARWGSFYRFNKDGSYEVIKTDIGVSNGLCWYEKLNKFYYIDSIDMDVKEYDYDPATGNITNERKVIDFDNGERPPPFVPDGMVVDEEGNLYVATFGGHKVVKVNPRTGKVELEIKIPAEQVTSVAWGGPNLDVLFVTSSCKPVRKDQPPPAGGLFKVTGLGVKGTPMYSVDLD